MTYVLSGLLLAGVVFAALWTFFFLTLAVSAITGARPDLQTPGTPEVTAGGVVAIIVFIAAYGLGLLSVRAFVTARIQNLVWNSITLSHARVLVPDSRAAAVLSARDERRGHDPDAWTVHAVRADSAGALHGGGLHARPARPARRPRRQRAAAVRQRLRRGSRRGLRPGHRPVAS